MKIKSILLSIAATLAFVACATAESPKKNYPGTRKSTVASMTQILKFFFGISQNNFL